jgi:hypothetical protein
MRVQLRNKLGGVGPQIKPYHCNSADTPKKNYEPYQMIWQLEGTANKNLDFYDSKKLIQTKESNHIVVNL